MLASHHDWKSGRTSFGNAFEPEAIGQASLQRACQQHRAGRARESRALDRFPALFLQSCHVAEPPVRARGRDASLVEDKRRLATPNRARAASVLAIPAVDLL
jgi:hypothetical protein